MANLVIVESPAKAATIKGYLGSNYKVIASKGHIRDLPKSTLGIDVDNGFAPRYINIRGKGDVIKELKKEAKAANKIFLATDPDREGEAISWHIASELGIDENSACRVTFNEITKGAVKSAIKSPRKINTDLVNSQQARRILDRLVGFNLSEVLWKNISGGLSGGRVQSVAARIIIEREREIASFVPQEYWTIEVDLSDGVGEAVPFKFYGTKKGRKKLSSEPLALKVEDAIKTGEFKILSVKHQVKQKQPMPPFTTSTMQQEASKKLGFQSQKTMKVAQEMYDGLNLGHEFGGVQGLITYMRTDSTRVSETAVTMAQEFIGANIGEEYLPKSRRVFGSRAAQDAHEAIRPSDVALTPKKLQRVLSSDQYKLYKLIWERFIASQMASAVLDTVTTEVENNGYVFRSCGQAIKFPGYLSIYDADDEVKNEDSEQIADTEKLLSFREGELLDALSVIRAQHFTEPPARYTEASLIKFLEENGIGRPSTYAPIISIIINRNYVKRDGKTLVATPLGEITTDFMKEHFPNIVDYEFTAFMENELDSIEQGEKTINGVIGEFYQDFAKELEKIAGSSKPAGITVPAELTDYECPRCGKKMVYKSGRFGKFLACSDYPTCKGTVAVDNDGVPVKAKEKKVILADFKCELCGADVVQRSGRYGDFYACTNYPKCRFTKQKTMPIGVKCPDCGDDIVARHGKQKALFYTCQSYPGCGFSSWDKPLGVSCPDCGGMLYHKKIRNAAVCKKCDYKEAYESGDHKDE